VFEAIVDFCQDGRDSDVAILLSGDPSSLEVTLYSQGPGLANLFSFDQGLYCMDLNENELCSCIIQLADEYGLEFSLSSVNVAMKVLLEHKSRPHFANYDSVRGVVSSSAARMRSRVSTSSALQHTTASSSSMVVTPADVSKESTVHSARLYNMKSIHTQLSEAMVRLKVGEKMTHFTFLGDSGAGHSTIAGILAEHMLELGLIMRSAVVEVSALTIKSDSVTELSAEIESILMDSKGGVLLINDAHEFMCGSLGFAGFNAFIDALHTAEENRTLIVLSGRESIMMDMMTRQPGLMKKFANVIRLPVWSVDVCVDCIVSTTHEDGLGLEALAVEALRHGFEALQERPGWSHVRDVMDVYLDLIVARLTRIQGFHSSSDVVGWCEGVVAPLITFADADTVMRRLLALRPRDVHPTPRYAATATATHVSTATGAMGHAERQARLRYEGFCRTLEESGRPPLTVPRPDVATTPGLAESTNAVHVNPIATENGASGPKSAAVTDVDDACPVAEDAMSSFLGEVPREPTVPPDNLAPPLPSASPSDALEPTSTVAHSVSQPHMLLSHRQRGAFDSFRIRMPSIHGMRTTSTSSLTRRSSSSALHSEPGITSELSESDQEDLVSILSDADESDDDNEELFADFDKLEAQANIAQDDFARDWNALSAALNEISSATSASGPRQELTAGASFGSGDVSLSDIDGFDESELFFPNNLS
jgi:adenylate kinase family enzyme